jgi:probable blue pigment (indigoidine) exporter
MVIRYRNPTLFGVAAVLIGGTYVATRAGLSYLPPVFFASLRFGLAGVLLLLYVRMRSTQWKPRTHDDWYTILAAGGLVVGAANTFLFIGQQFTTSTTASIIASLSPILTIGFAVIFLSDTALSPQRILGISCGLIGVVIVAQPDFGRLFAANVVGKGLIFVAAVALALGTVLMRRHNPSLSTKAITGWAMLLGGIGLFVLSLLLSEPIAHARWTQIAILAVIYNGLLATPIGYAAYFELIDSVGPVQSNLVLYAAPVVTALVEWILLDEIISVVTIIGFSVIAVGFVLVQYQTFTTMIARVRHHSKSFTE